MDVEQFLGSSCQLQTVNKTAWFMHRCRIWPRHVGWHAARVNVNERELNTCVHVLGMLNVVKKKKISPCCHDVVVLCYFRLEKLKESEQCNHYHQHFLSFLFSC